MNRTNHKKPSVILPAVLVLALTAGLLVLLAPRAPLILVPDAAEVQAAGSLLRDSLEESRFTYYDFMSGKNRADLSAMDRQPGLSALPAPADQALVQGDRAVYTLNVPAAGLYSLSADCLVLNNSFTNITLSALVNGETQYSEAKSISIPVLWKDSTKEFPLDTYGDETVPSQSIEGGWRRVDFYDGTAISQTPLLFALQAGENTLELVNTTSQPVRFGELLAVPSAAAPSYAEYLARIPGSVRVIDRVITVDAIEYASKNTPYIQLAADMNAGASPFDPVNKKINVLSIRKAGSEVFFQVDVPEAGFYHLALHCITVNEDFANFCSFKLDGEAPFREAASFALSPYKDSRWHNQVWQDESGEPYKIYFSEGSHTLSFRMEIEPVARQLRDLQLLIDHINQFSLDIKKVTGKEVDRNRTWRLSRYIPETAAYLDAYDSIYRDILFSLSRYSLHGTDSSVLSSIKEALTLLDKLREKPDELPLYIENLSGNTVSILKLAGNVMDALYTQGMTLDGLYIYGEENALPQENASALTSLGASLSRIWASYVSPKYVVRRQKDALNIWVNQSVVHVDILQKLVDTRFTPQTGIKVHLSVMPDINKLVLAKAAGTNPDVALGLPSHVPFDLASRGAIYDLTRFGDFWQYSKKLVPGTFVSYLFNEGVYALPETVDFAVTVYREDIFRQLNLRPPDTWEDVTEMMSELQRLNMSFYMPIASGDGYKWFYQTSPLIYQNGGALYSPDGLGTAINEPNAVKGLTFLGDLFTTYALAEQVPVFFNSFRFGQTPVGILDSASYILLKNGAPELAGQWNITPYPGTMQADGSIARWFIANGRGAVIFENTDKIDASWEFLKWWLDAEIQTEFAFNLAANYNILWLSANIEALGAAPMEDKDLRVVLESMGQLRDVPRSPGQYMLERSLSDIWNTIVFDGTPAQVAIDMKVIDIQREFRRKMTESGYIDAKGTALKPYKVRELDWVLGKLGEAGL